MEDKKTKVEFLIRYKSNGVKPGEGRQEVKAGLHARCTCDDAYEEGALKTVRKEAERQLARCKRYFNENIKIVKVEDPNGELGDDGMVKTTEKKVVLTKVIVHAWIDTYVNGKRTINGDPAPDKQHESPAQDEEALKALLEEFELSSGEGDEGDGGDVTQDEVETSAVLAAAD